MGRGGRKREVLKTTSKHVLLLYAACLCLIFLASPARSLGRTSLLGHGKNKEEENRPWGRRSVLSGSHGAEQTLRGNNKDLHDSKFLLCASLYCQGDRWLLLEASLCPCVGKWHGVLERYDPPFALGKKSLRSIELFEMVKPCWHLLGCVLKGWRGPTPWRDGTQRPVFMKLSTGGDEWKSTLKWGLGSPLMHLHCL